MARCSKCLGILLLEVEGRLFILVGLAAYRTRSGFTAHWRGLKLVLPGARWVFLAESARMRPFSPLFAQSREGSGQLRFEYGGSMGQTELMYVYYRKGWSARCNPKIPQITMIDIIRVCIPGYNIGVLQRSAS